MYACMHDRGHCELNYITLVKNRSAACSQVRGILPPKKSSVEFHSSYNVKFTNNAKIIRLTSYKNYNNELFIIIQNLVIY